MPLVHLMLLTTEIQIRIQILISMSKVILSLAAIVAVVALFWPFIEENFINATGCPWPFDYFHGASSANETSVPTKPATTIKEFLRLTPDELRAYDGSDESKYLLMAVDGKILDVESGAKFYRKGATYNVFAGRVSRWVTFHSFIFYSTYLL